MEQIAGHLLVGRSGGVGSPALVAAAAGVLTTMAFRDQNRVESPVADALQRSKSPVPSPMVKD